MKFYNIPNTNILMLVEPKEAHPIIERYFETKIDNINLQNFFCTSRSSGIKIKFRFNEELTNMSMTNLELAKFLIEIFPKIDSDTWVTFDRPLNQRFDLDILSKYLETNN